MRVTLRQLIAASPQAASRMAALEQAKDVVREYPDAVEVIGAAIVDARPDVLLQDYVATVYTSAPTMNY